MRVFASEFGHSYETYSFAYCVYAEREGREPLAPIYEKGFLPYSGAKGVRDVFYMARSVRALVQECEMTSENRRVLKKFDNEFDKVTKTVLDVRHDSHFFKLCMAYFNLAHGSAMPRERLELILDAGIISHVVEYKKDGVPVAYFLSVEEESFSHYWFSFYHHDYAKTSLGMWLALDSIRELKKDSRKKYFYFGTCYAEKALYKTNVTPFEFWDGASWVSDDKLLKSLCRSDKVRHIDNHPDRYKQSLHLFA